jgi:PEGA domain-containing protein
MFRGWKTYIFVLAGILTLAPLASAARGSATSAPSTPVVVQRFVVVRPFGWYDPWWGPAYVPYGYVPAQYTGEVRIVTERKDARIYVDGGFAGRADKLKKFPLQAGNHNIELRDSDGRTFYQERVQVIAGKTTKIHIG